MRKLLAIFIFSFIFLYFIRIPFSYADEFGIGQFSVNPNPFNPNQEKTTTISGVVYHISPEGNLSSPSVTVVINDQLNLLVEVSLLSSEQLVENSSALLSEWSFQATWDGTDERGQILPPGEYTCTINLDLPNVGKDTKSGTITVNAE